ncbi:MAG: DUF2784 domain-containing protein [Woeseiaceae bacterium]|nr:DUF2784 domain-containing protein [Woeseiaceae bacterium]
MFYRLAADLTLLTHFAFIVLVIGGALLVLRYPWFVWIHVPAAVWGAYVELSGRLCPLTTLENWLRWRAGEDGYSVSFVEQYVLPVIYPAGLTRDIQLLLAAVVITVNVALYSFILLRYRKKLTNHEKDHQ